MRLKMVRWRRKRDERSGGSAAAAAESEAGGEAGRTLDSELEQQSPLDASSAPLGRTPTHAKMGALARAKAANTAWGRRRKLSVLRLTLSTSGGSTEGNPHRGREESSPHRGRQAHYLDSVLVLEHPDEPEVSPAGAPARATTRRRLSPNAILRQHRRSREPWLGVGSGDAPAPVPEDAPAAQETPSVGSGYAPAPVPEDAPAAQETPSVGSGDPPVRVRRNTLQNDADALTLKMAQRSA